MSPVLCAELSSIKIAPCRKGCGRGLVAPASAASDGVRSDRLVGSGYGPVELGAQAVYVLLLALNPPLLGGISAIEDACIELVRAGQLLLGLLEIGAEAVDVVSPGGGLNFCRVVPQAFRELRLLLDQIEQTQDGANLGVMSGSITKLLDDITERRIEPNVVREGPRLLQYAVQQYGDDDEHDDDGEKQDGGCVGH